MDQRHESESTAEERQQDVADSVKAAIVWAADLVPQPISHKIVECRTGDPNEREDIVGSTPSKPVRTCDLRDWQV